MWTISDILHGTSSILSPYQKESLNLHDCYSCYYCCKAGIFAIRMCQCVGFFFAWLGIVQKLEHILCMWRCGWQYGGRYWAITLLAHPPLLNILSNISHLLFLSSEEHWLYEEIARVLLFFGSQTSEALWWMTGPIKFLNRVSQGLLTSLEGVPGRANDKRTNLEINWLKKPLTFLIRPYNYLSVGLGLDV